MSALGLTAPISPSFDPFHSAVQTTASTVVKVAKAGVSVSEFLTSGSTWKGIGLCIAGGLLVLLGLLQLTGRDVSSVVQAARP